MSVPFVNGAFSKQLPHLQLIVDQTSLGLFKKCARKYLYRMILGLVPRRPNFHLQFGTWMHEGCEKYEIAKCEGKTHEEAMIVAVRYVLGATWDYQYGKPWDSGDPDKNRYTLLRTLIWYLDDFGEHDTMQTLVLKNGKPAVELTFKFNPEDFETGDRLTALTGELIEFRGHIDRLVWFEGARYVSDRKTTGKFHKLNEKYFAQYTPNNQFSMYALASRWYFDIQVAGIVCDAARVTSTTSEFLRMTIERSEAHLREWYADAKYWLQLMGKSAESDRWPQNDTACNEYGGCEYREICRRSPAARKTFMDADYVRSPWDPSVNRGE